MANQNDAGMFDAAQHGVQQQTNQLAAHQAPMSQSIVTGPQFGQPMIAPSDSSDAEISLATLSDEEIQKIMRAFKAGKEAADDYYKSKIEPKIMHRLKVYKADKALYKKKFPALSELNNWLSKDVKTTIDWILPNLIEVFNGSESPVDIVGQSAEDDENAKLLQEIINYFVTKKNNFFTFIYTFAKDGLVTNFGCAKVYWNRDEDREPMQVLAEIIR